jgi:probable F420-dependent oxidoreductase
MKLNVPMPFDDANLAEQFCSAEAVAQIGRTVEKAGFHAAMVTDHPCPTGRWLDAGGHHAQDPFVTLALLGAVTTMLRLQTGLLVLPYRNPFVVARSVATLDRLSNGRMILSVGAGYLKGEFRAVGADFNLRNTLMDEYMRALKTSLSGGEFAFEGTGYEAFGNRIQPGPLQKPHPPLLVGGNSRRAIRRVVELGDGWNPFFTSADGIDTATTRTAAMTGEADLIAGIAYMKEYCGQVGRQVLPKVVLGIITAPGEKCSPQALVDRIGRYTELGVEAAGVIVEGRSCNEWCDDAERLGGDVISKI